MSRLIFNTDEGKYSFDNEELIEHLENNGYVVLGDKVNSLDKIDYPMLEEIQDKFLNSNWAERAEIYNKVVHGKYI